MLCRLSPTPLAIFLASVVLLHTCQANRPQGERPNFVFRGDNRTPDEIRQAGGFLPHEDVDYSDYMSYSLNHHVHGWGMTAYVSTSASFGQAARNFAGPGNYVYRIRVTSTMIDVNDAMSEPPYRVQEEASALGGIPWNAVEAWWRYPDDDQDSRPDYDWMCIDDTAAYDLTSRYESHFEHQFERNDAFVEGPVAAIGTRHDNDVAVLAASRPNATILESTARHFMDRHGAGVGWSLGQTFPLWQPVPNSAQPSPSRCRRDPPPNIDDNGEEGTLADDDLMEIATTIHDQGRHQHEDPCPEGAGVSFAAQVVAGRMELLQQRTHSASDPAASEQERNLAEAEEALRGVRGSCVILSLCAALNSLQWANRDGRRKRNTITTTGPPARMRSMCSIVSEYRDFEPWHYGSSRYLEMSTLCHGASPECEEAIGTEVYCSRAADPDACFSKRQPPPFLSRREDCQPGQANFHDGAENCVGTEAWCRGDSGWLAAQSSVTPEECLLRRTPAPLARNGCAHIEHLSVRFKLTDNAYDGAGTYDTIMLSLGKQNITLADDPSARFAVSKHVSLKDAFRSPVVSLQDVKRVALLDKLGSHPSAGDAWQFQGIILTGRCAATSKTIAVKKFQAVNKWLKHGPGKEIKQVWSADIHPEDWREVSNPEELNWPPPAPHAADDPPRQQTNDQPKGQRAPKPPPYVPHIKHDEMRKLHGW